MAAVLTAGNIAVLAANGHPNSPSDVVASLCVVLFGALAAGRRRAPVPLAMLGGLLLAFPDVIGRAATLNAPGIDALGILAAFLYAYALGDTGRWLYSLVGLVPLTAGVAAAGAVPTWSNFNPLAEMITVGPWLAGLAVASRRRLLHQLELRARELEEEREVFAQQSVRYERARIARDLHDIVAHCVSLMVVQASAGEHLTPSDPASAAEAFASITDAARQADGEIQRLVAMLGTPRTTPGLQIVDDLVLRTRASGVSISCQFVGDSEGFAGNVSEAAYRIVQEAVTNAMKHAPGAAIAIVLRFDRDAMRLTVMNGAPAAAVPSALAGSGGRHGLPGMRERAADCGGTVDAGPTVGSGWRVVAQLPRRPAGVPVSEFA